MVFLVGNAVFDIRFLVRAPVRDLVRFSSTFGQFSRSHKSSLFIHVGVISMVFLVGKAVFDIRFLARTPVRNLVKFSSEITKPSICQTQFQARQKKIEIPYICLTHEREYVD